MHRATDQQVGSSSRTPLCRGAAQDHGVPTDVLSDAVECAGGTRTVIDNHHNPTPGAPPAEARLARLFAPSAHSTFNCPVFPLRAPTSAEQGSPSSAALDNLQHHSFVLKSEDLPCRPSAFSRATSLLATPPANAGSVSTPLQDDGFQDAVPSVALLYSAGSNCYSLKSECPPTPLLIPKNGTDAGRNGRHRSRRKKKVSSSTIVNMSTRAATQFQSNGVNPAKSKASRRAFFARADNKHCTQKERECWMRPMPYPCPSTKTPRSKNALNPVSQKVHPGQLAANERFAKNRLKELRDEEKDLRQQLQQSLAA